MTRRLVIAGACIVLAACSGENSEEIRAYCETYDRTEPSLREHMEVIEREPTNVTIELRLLSLKMATERVSEIWTERQEVAPEELHDAYGTQRRYGLTTDEESRPSERQRLDDAVEKIKSYTEDKCGFS